MIALSVTPMTSMQQILARQKFVADLEARNYQTRAWNTLTHAGRLWRSGIRAHDARFDGPAERPPSAASLTTGYYRPGAENQNGVPSNPAQVNGPRNAVAMAIKPVQEFNGVPGYGQTGERVAVQMAVPVSTGALGADEAKKKAAEKLALDAQETKKKELELASVATKAAIEAANREKAAEIKQLIKQAKRASDELAKLNANPKKDPIATAVDPNVTVPPPAPKEGTPVDESADKDKTSTDAKDEAVQPETVETIASVRAQIMNRLADAGKLSVAAKDHRQRNDIAAETAKLIEKYVAMKMATGAVAGPKDDVEEFQPEAKAKFMSSVDEEHKSEAEARWNAFGRAAGPGVRGASRKKPAHPFRTYLGFGAIKMSGKRKRSTSKESKDSDATQKSAASVEKKLLSM
jgi:chemotaxis protein histidine kinase CheA